MLFRLGVAPGQTLVVGEHLARFLLGVPIVLDKFLSLQEGLTSPVCHGEGLLLRVLSAGILNSLGITML